MQRERDKHRLEIEILYDSRSKEYMREGDRV